MLKHEHLSLVNPLLLLLTQLYLHTTWPGQLFHQMKHSGWLHLTPGRYVVVRTGAGVTLQGPHLTEVFDTAG